MRLFNGKRILSMTLALTLAFSLSVPQVAAKEQSKTDESRSFTVTREPKRLFAKAVADFEKAEKGELKLAVSDLLETDVYYEALSDDEKLLYDTYAELYNNFNPYSSSDEYNDKATSGGPMTESLADDILSRKVIMLKLSGQYTREQRQEMYNNVEKAFRYDHPYDQVGYLYKVSVRIDNSGMLYLALTHYSKANDFDYKEWAAKIVQFEEKAITEIMSDSRYNDAEESVREILVHDYICNRVKYDSSKPADNTLLWYKIKGAYGPMTEDNGVCIGIAKMAKILLDDLGIPTYILTSSTHAWNMVCIGGEYYDLDCTWDLDYGKGMKYRYFNRTTAEMTTLDTGDSHIRDKMSNRLPISYGTRYTYDAVCEIMNTPQVKNAEVDTVPVSAKQDYVEDDSVGELCPEAEDYEYDGLIYDLYTEGYAVCKGAVSDRKTVDIPQYIIYTDEDGAEYGYQVIMIDEGAFAGSSRLKKVTICDQIMMIAAGAFYKCKKLKTIVFGDAQQLDSIDEGAFKGINKKATFYMATDSYSFKFIKQMIKESGVPKKVKYKRLG